MKGLLFTLVLCLIFWFACDDTMNDESGCTKETTGIIMCDNNIIMACIDGTWKTGANCNDTNTECVLDYWSEDLGGYTVGLCVSE